MCSNNSSHELNIFLNSKTKKFFNVVNFICFVLLMAFVINILSWTFRGNEINSRGNVSGFKNVKGNVDVVTIGSSNTYTFYIPLQAYRDYGFTSYNFATSASQFDLVRFYIEEIKKYKNPELFVINIGGICSLSEEYVNEGALRGWSDSLDVFSITRLKSIISYLKSRNTDSVDIPSAFFDLSKYHKNIDALGKENQFEIVLGQYENVNKGYYGFTSYVPFVKSPEVSDQKRNLTEYENDAIIKLLDYCDKKNINVLFIVNPYYINENDWMCLNSVKDIIESRGYNCINFNEYINDIDLDYSFDFRDAMHVNYYGATKFTDFFANYLKSHYSLPDHRDEEIYSSWDEDVKTFETFQKEWQAELDEYKSSLIKSQEIGRELHTINDFSEWYLAALDSNFSMFIVYNGQAFHNINSYEFDYFADVIGLKKDMPFAGIYSSGEQYKCIYDDSVDEGRFGSASIYYYINSGKNATLNVMNENYMICREGIHIVVMDNNYFDIYDSVTLGLDKEGKIIIYRD